MTATQLIYDALLEIGCLRHGQTTSTDINNDGLRRLNQMISGWLLDRLMVYAVTPDIYPLVAAQQQYTIGPSGADFTAARPTQIEEANIILNTVSPVVRYGVEIYRDPKQWAALTVQQLPNAIPQVLWYEKDFITPQGNATINIWPGPLLSYGLELYTWKQLQQFADLTTNYTFPPGYEKCLRQNLAVELAPSMKSSVKIPEPLLGEVARQAMEAKQAIQSYNAPTPVMAVDPAFCGGSRKGGFNYATGLFGRSGA